LLILRAPGFDFIKSNEQPAEKSRDVLQRVDSAGLIEWTSRKDQPKTNGQSNGHEF
jgi:hypothetical protein